MPCEVFPLGAVCDEFCAVFCCYYVHICLVKCTLDGLSVMSFYVYYVHKCLVRLALKGLLVMSFVQYFIIIMYTCLVRCTLDHEGLPVMSFVQHFVFVMYTFAL